jgi:hypothetical protein
MNMFVKIAAAAALVLVCSVTDSNAQQPIRGQVVGGVRVNNVYNYGGNGNWNGSYNCVGCFPGSGPYDSMIAVTGIAAGASIINNIINSTARPPQQPQTVIVNNPTPVVVQPNVSVAQPVYESGPGCQIFITGYSPSGVPVYVRACR